MKVLDRSRAEANPLRKWRNAQEPRVTLIDAAVLLDVSITTIKEWERGSLTPSDGNLAKIAAVLKTPIRDLRLEWLRWLDKIRAA